MKIALYQMDSVWEDAAENRHKAHVAISAANADLVVLPEMFATGFSTDPVRVAQKMDGETVTWLVNTAKEQKKALVTSVVIEEDGKYYNRLFFVFPDGSYQTYDKRHLFRMAGEHHNYTGGENRLIVEYMGWRIMPLVCYDLRFPVWSRNRGDYDMLIYIASWPDSRSYAWSSLLRARAIENLCYVAGVDRVGSDPVAKYSGDSAILDFKGMEVAVAEPYKEKLIMATPDMKALQKFRNDFPAFMDADNFTIG